MTKSKNDMVSGDTYLIRDRKENVLHITSWEGNCVQIGIASGNHTFLGFAMIH